MKILLAQEPLSDSSRLDQNCATRTMRSLLVLLCLTLASTGPDSAPGSPLDLDPSLDSPSGSPVALEAGPVNLDASPAAHEEPDFEAALEAILEEEPGAYGPPSEVGQSADNLELEISHPEDLFAESGELDWITEEVPGVVEEQIAEEECRKSATLDKKREKKEKKKDKKHAKDKKKKLQEGQKDAKNERKEPVVVPAREELERYCTIQEISSGHLNPWATDPHLQRPAIIAAIAQRLGCSYVALGQWKTHILCWIEFRAAQGRCVRKAETEDEQLLKKSSGS